MTERKITYHRAPDGTWYGIPEPDWETRRAPAASPDEQLAASIRYVRARWAEAERSWAAWVRAAHRAD